MPTEHLILTLVFLREGKKQPSYIAVRRLLGFLKPTRLGRKRLRTKLPLR